MKLSSAFIFLILFLVTSCNKTETFTIGKWSIETGTSGTMSVSHSELGAVLNRVQFVLADGGSSKTCGHWKITKENNKLRIVTKPVSEWTVTFSETGIDFSTKTANCRVIATAPAGEKRIPARVAKQDNDVMYTQMGLVSATNIHNLFDMNSDIMIGFPDNSRLTRNEKDNTLMDVNFNIVDGEEIVLTPDYYNNVVGLSEYDENDYKPAYSPKSDRFKTAPTGWSSWYCYYMSPTEESLYEETDAIAKKLKPYGVKYIQLDAAYTRGDSANWLEWYKGFYPSGGKAWFGHVKEQGMIPGLWMNIYGANYENPAMSDKKYPENFYLRDKDGKLSAVCCSADKTVKRLDYTNPEVFEKHLKPLFETLVNEWGLGYVKAGGWGTWMDYFEKNRESAFDPGMKSRDVYRKTLKTVREALGDNGYLLGCAMHEIGVGFDYFDGSRTGGDDYADWTGKNHWSGGMQTFFRSLFGSNYLNGICWWSDPDDVMVRDPLTVNEGQTIVSTISLAGQAYVFSDYVAGFSKERLDNFLSSKYNIGWAKKFPELVKPLPEEKLDLYRKTMPSMPIKAMDLYPFKVEAKCCPEPKTFPKALDLKVNAATGMYDVVSLYNWSDADTLKSLKLGSDLGLDESKSYTAFDFWNKKLIDVKNGRIEETVPKHGTLALIIRPVENHPQLLATSRHITSAYSIKSYKWNDKTGTMSGESAVVPGDKYVLYIAIPENTDTKNIKVSASPSEITVNADKNLIAVSFTCDNELLTWDIKF